MNTLNFRKFLINALRSASDTPDGENMHECIDCHTMEGIPSVMVGMSDGSTFMLKVEKLRG